MALLSRSSQNAAIFTAPGQTGVLQEAGVHSSVLSHTDIGFDLDWMLSIPFLFKETSSKSSITSLSDGHLTSGTLPILEPDSAVIETSLCAWSRIAFSLASFVKRKTSVEIMCVKADTDHKLQFVDYVPPSSSTDVVTLLSELTMTDTGNPFVDGAISLRRDAFYEWNTAAMKTKQIECVMQFPYEKKFNSMPCVSYSTRLKAPVSSVQDTTIALYQPFTPNYGALYPTTYPIYLFVCYAGSELFMLCNPGECPISAYDTYVDETVTYLTVLPVARTLPGVPIVPLTLTLDSSSEPINP